jgi:hypothetical protein
VSRLLTFIAIALVILGSIHYYLWRRLIRDPAWRAPWRTVGAVGLTALALSVVASMILGRGRGPVRSALAWPGYVWLGVMFLFLVALAAADLIRFGAWLARRAAELARDRRWRSDRPRAERRRFLARAAAAGVTSAVAGASAVALRAGLRPPPVQPIAVRLDRLPPQLHGFSIVQLTDIHAGPTIGRRFVEDVVARTNALSPDLVAITGDLVDGGVAELADVVAPLTGLRAPHGVFWLS